MNPAIDRLTSQERAQQIIACLTGEEMLIVHMVLNGYNRREIAEHLEVDRRDISRRLGRAKARILSEVPELEPAVAGRSAQRGAKHRRNGGSEG